ncbi:MAG TPA: ubiquitin-like domain-containing protein, partial [Pseudonocardia sp.]
MGRAPDADPPTEQLPAVPGAPDGPAALPATPPAVSRPPLAPQPAAVVSPGPTGRRRALVRVGVVTALLTLVATGATAVAADKVVTVTVDGRDRVVHTFAADVAGALRSAGLAAAPQDRLEPAPTTDLADGDHVILQRARPLTLVEGRSERRIWTTAASVDEALRNVGVEAQPIQMSTAPRTTIPLGGLAVEVRVPRAVTFVDGSAAPQPAAVVSPGPTGRRRALVRAGVVTALIILVATGATAVAADKVVTVTVDGRDRVVHTFAADVAGALRSAGLAAAPQDRLEPAPTTDLADGDHVILQRARPLTLVEGRSERRIWT